jgi:3'-phosphoadenosine 5'-phosphosulfate sulfotransferase (PAPS reductase)/FAD synthetase
MHSQPTLFPIDPVAVDIDPLGYDHYIVSFSGGKDSMACLLHLLELGVPAERVELWHMLVDGRDRALMDWPVTEAYCRAVAAHFGMPMYLSWKDGGFRGELLRNGKPTTETWWERPDGKLDSAGGKGPPGTRMQFPQVSADLKVRWCSAYLKIDVCSKAIANQERFHGKRTVIVTGERGEESSNRAKYAVHEADRYTHRPLGKAKRHVMRWRPVRDWKEAEVWAIMERWKVRPHPAYELGFGRVSCATCIFGNADQWATVAACLPGQVQEVVDLERMSGKTIQRKLSVPELVGRGRPYAALTEGRAQLVRQRDYTLPVRMDPWVLPAGAFGDGCGPS